MPETSLEEFTSGLAKQLRAQERKRFVRFAIAVGSIIMIFLALLLHAQSNDRKLRENLVKQCDARNKILETQRSSWVRLIAVSPEAQRKIWADSLSQLPPPQACQDYLTN